MTQDTLVLVGQEGTHVRETLATHADRIARRGAVDAAHAVTYSEEPGRELRERFRSLPEGVVYVVPAALAHSRETTDVLPRTFPAFDGTVRYCEPIGRSPAITRLVIERATALVEADRDGTLVLVGQGSSSQPYHRQMVEYHATRIAERTDYAAVEPTYLLQNPAVECVRYAVETERSVAVPLFLTANATTDRRIPAKLELDRGGMAYADPLGDHSLVTDAIEGEITRQRALATADRTQPASFEDALVQGARSVATDGEGRP
ncbi:CbiX/SirB N-terminal domain-containing protein [Halorientalis pallida]|uniref:CbiX/SirB N-terminal domain-containing protein n=1 Tax=Halorientalis pallida TaxID=2479928 RepID=UPI003C6F76FA